MRLLRRCYRGETKDGPLSLLGHRKEFQGTSCHLSAPCGQRCPHSSLPKVSSPGHPALINTPPRVSPHLGSLLTMLHVCLTC